MDKLDPVAMAEKAAEQLIGTCKGMTDLGEEYEALELNSKFCDKLDELCFECQQCNWWCAAEELSENEDEWICQECENG